MNDLKIKVFNNGELVTEKDIDRYIPAFYKDYLTINLTQTTEELHSLTVVSNSLDKIDFNTVLTIQDTLHHHFINGLFSLLDKQHYSFSSAVGNKQSLDTFIEKILKSKSDTAGYYMVFKGNNVNMVIADALTCATDTPVITSSFDDARLVSKVIIVFVKGTQNIIGDLIINNSVNVPDNAGDFLFEFMFDIPDHHAFEAIIPI
jgi:hypothetical protein